MSNENCINEARNALTPILMIPHFGHACYKDRDNDKEDRQESAQNDSLHIQILSHHVFAS
jgi:hypothetical protein